MTIFSKYLENDKFIQWVVNPTDESNVYWETYLKNNPLERENVNEVKAMILAMKPEDVVLTVFRKKRILDKLIARKKEIDRRSGIVGFFQRSMRYGAIALIMVGLAATYIYLGVGETHTALVIEDEIITLTLDDGTVKTIDEAQVQHIMSKNGTIVGSQNGEELDYQIDAASEELAFNSLYVPYGKTFKLVLSDGTKVHLNSGSSLKYPVKFLEGHERQVFLKGEAYFDVVKDEQHAFTVNSNDLNIRVLGTRFNVSSYPEDESVNTVLVSGAVRLYADTEIYSDATSALLKPGELGAFDKSIQKIAINLVDTNLYTGWIDGKLIFRSTPFKIIRQRLERHYNVTIKSTNKELDSIVYNAVFETETIEEVLISFQKNFKLDYSIIENEVIIN